MKNTWKNTVFLRLFIMFVLIMSPICGIGITIYTWGIHAIQDEIYKSMVSQVTFYLKGLDTEIQRMKLLQYECTANDDLNKLTFAYQSLNNYDKSQAMLRLAQHLFVIKSSSRYIADVSVSIIKLNITISTNGGIMSMDKDELKLVKSPFIASPSRMMYRNGSFYLSVDYPISVKNMQKVSYIIRIRLLEKAFMDDINQFNTYEESLSMMTSKTGDFLLVNGKSNYQKESMWEQLEKEIKQSQTGTYHGKVNGRKYLAIYSTSDYLGLSLARYIPERVIFSWTNRYKIWIWIFSLVSLVIIILFFISVHRFIHKPLNNLVKAFKNVEGGDLKVNIEYLHNDEFRYLYRSFNAMVLNLSTLIDQVYKQKILMQNAELKQLQAQINPHFLYNTFFMLYSITKAEDYENVMSFLQQLGSYFKFITRNGEDQVPLEREVEHARTYTNIQNLRFSRRITIQFEELPEKYRHLKVPRLIIQPIIENSFKYGLEDKVSEGILQIRFREFRNFLCIMVEDNGNGMNSYDMITLKNVLANKEYGGEVTGIVNIHKRLQLKFGEKSGLVISNSEIGGLKVVVKIEMQGDENGNIQTIGG